MKTSVSMQVALRYTVVLECDDREQTDCQRVALPGSGSVETGFQRGRVVVKVYCDVASLLFRRRCHAAGILLSSVAVTDRSTGSKVHCSQRVACVAVFLYLGIILEDRSMPSLYRRGVEMPCATSAR